MTLQNFQWEPVYESAFTGSDSLIHTFYRPFLSEAEQYDRLAGYLSLKSLADALEGVDSLLETDGTIRVIAGTDLRERDKPVLFPDTDDPVSPRRESQLAIIASLVDEGRLEIKVAEPTTGDGLFHPKLGIASDADENVVTFEGSVNETPSAWHRNYERFKVHRSWVDGEAKYVSRDVETFKSLWEDDHPAVNVYPLNEATEQELVSWKPDTDAELNDHVEHVRETAPDTTVSEAATAEVLDKLRRTPGSLHIAEDVSAVNPWPHQRVISDTAVSIYPNNLLFCDEVGLGKTIEAGLTISRLFRSGRADNALFLTPGGLANQWQEELRDKFNIHALRYDKFDGSEYLVAPDGQRLPLDGELDGPWDETPLGDFLADRDEPTAVILSWHTARREDNRGLAAPTDDETTPWDVTVVDEAHSAREGTHLYDLLTRVNLSSRCLYALTATPMQLNVGELYDLLRLCNLPEMWQDKERFSRFFETRQALHEALNEVTAPASKNDLRLDSVLIQLGNELDEDDPEVRERVADFAEMLHEHLTNHPGYDDRVTDLVDESDVSGLSERRTLGKLLGSESTTTFDDPRNLIFDLSPVAWRTLVDASEWGTPVQTRVFRNTRTVLRKCDDLGLLDDNIPWRDVTTETIGLGEAEDLYERVESYISGVYKKSQQELTGTEKVALGFVMTTYRQRLTSSLYAAQQSLLRRYEKLHDQFDQKNLSTAPLGTDIASLAHDPGGVTEATLQATLRGDLNAYVPEDAEGIVAEELDELASFIGTLEQAVTDPKLGQLKSDIKQLRRDARDNIIIFTQYEDTLRSICAELARTHPHIGTYTGTGGSKYDAGDDEWVSVSKEAIKRDFTDKDGNINILVCTDSASEGLNLQTGDALINYDLPWNPMRVEQRIGRIDRIGQTNEVVKVINYVYEDTVEGDIYERLGHRLNLFEDVVGTMRPVLSGLEEDIESAVMTGDPSADLDDEVANSAEERNEEVRSEAEAAGLADDLEAVGNDRDALVEYTKLHGWDTYTHPDLDKIGNEDRRHGPLVTPRVFETVFTHSKTLSRQGWEFTALRRHDAADQYPDATGAAYVLTPPPGESPAWWPPVDAASDTAQHILSDSEASLVVTFSPYIADEYPSIRLLLPGEPVYENLVNKLVTDTPTPPADELTTVCVDLDGGTPRTWTTCETDTEGDPLLHIPAVFAENRRTTLPDGQDIPTVETAERNGKEWCREFSNLPTEKE